MAHELEIVNGKAQMAYAGETPWHGLGVQVSNDLTPNQMMKKAGLDWTVEKQSIYLSSGQMVPGKKALVRSTDEKILDMVGDDWNPVQNSEAFEFFSEYVMAGNMEMNTAGALFGGTKIWALAKVKESFDILGGDQVDSYLLFSNPHQYGQAIDVRFTPIRVVCNNTLSLSINGTTKNGVKLNHRNEFNPDMVKEQMGIASAKLAQYKEVAQFLASKRYTAEALIEYYSKVFPHSSNKDPKNYIDLSRPAKAAYDVLETQPGAEYAPGSWWQALNSVTYHTDHQMGRNIDNRLNSAWFGSNQKRKNDAVNIALEMANA